jgi:hypothetical protein
MDFLEASDEIKIGKNMAEINGGVQTSIELDEDESTARISNFSQSIGFATISSCFGGNFDSDDDASDSNRKHPADGQPPSDRPHDRGAVL